MMQTQSPQDEAPTQHDHNHQVAHNDGPRVRLRLLDGFRLEQDERPLSTPLSTRRVLAFLGVRGCSTRAEIAGTLWMDVPEGKAHASLRTALWRLRRLTSRQLVVGRDLLSLAATV